MLFNSARGSVKRYVPPDAPANRGALLDQIKESVIYLHTSRGSSAGEFRLRVGECFQAPPRMDFDRAEAVPCSEKHLFEMIATYRHPAGSDVPFPGDRLHRYASDACGKHFIEYVGIPRRESRLDTGTVVPAAEAWDNGDRELHCYAYDHRHRGLTESVRDSKQ